MASDPPQSASIRLGHVLGAITAVIAVYISWHRRAIAQSTRTPQSYRLYSEKTGKDFIYQVVQRSNSTDAYPTSITNAWFLPGAGGSFRNLPGSPPLHLHLLDDEILEVIEGRMGYNADGNEGDARPGQKAFLPAGKPHTFWNAEPERVLHLRVTLLNKSGKHSPSERFFSEQLVSNAYDRGGIDNVNPLQIMLTLKYGRIELAGPYLVRLLIWYVLCPLAEVLGFKGFYPEYIYA